MKELLAGIVAAILSIFGGHQAVTNSASNAAAAAASVAPSAIVATSSAHNPASVSAPPTIINQPVIERIVERTVQTAAPTGYVTQEAFTTAINELSDRFGRIISGSTYPAPATTFASGGVWNAVALTNRIDQLSGTSLSSITVSGVTGLTNADIPDDITASNYLPLSGGSLTFASSTLFSVFNGAYFGATATSSFDSAGALTLATPLLISSGGTGANTFGQGWIYSNGGTGALAASTSPTVNYITATSTTATSTFAGGLSVSGSSPLLQDWKTSAGTTSALLGYNVGYANAVQGRLLFPSNLASVQPTEGNAPLGIVTGSLSNLGVYDPVISMGYNPGVVAGVVQSGENALSYNIEGDYRQSDGSGGYQNVMEAYIQYNHTNGTWWRPFFFQINRADGTITNSYITGNPLVVQNESGTTLATIALGNISVAAQSGANGYLQVNAATGQYSSLALGYSGNNSYFQAYTQNGATIFNLAGTRIATLYSNVNGATGAALNVGGGFNGNGAIGGFAVGTSPVSTIGIGIQGRAGQTGNLFEARDSNDTKLTVINPTGRIGIGTSSPYALLSVSNSVSTAANTPLFVIASTTGGTATTTVFTVANTGNVTIIGSAATCTLGNGASATSCSSSDQRLKDDITTIDASSSLAAVEALRPVSFKWNQWMVGNGSATSTQFGFIAQDVMNAFPNLVTLDSNSHYYKLDYQGLFAPIVGAVQALAQKVADFTDSFTTKELTFTRATGDEITVRKANIQQANVQELCVGSTCLTESQVQALLNQAGQQPSAPSETPPASEPEEPQADEPILPATAEEPGETDNPVPEVSDATEEIPATEPAAQTSEPEEPDSSIPEASDAPPTVPADTPEDIPVTEPVDPTAQ
jgi:hypothetical protein